MLMRFMIDKPPENQSMLVNDIHSPVMVLMMHLTRVTLTEGLDKGLRLNSSLAGQLLLNFSLQISTLLPTLNPTNVTCIFISSKVMKTRSSSSGCTYTISPSPSHYKKMLFSQIFGYYSCVTTLIQRM